MSDSTKQGFDVKPYILMLIVSLFTATVCVTGRVEGGNLSEAIQRFFVSFDILFTFNNITNFLSFSLLFLSEVCFLVFRI